ncbi:hypothetical protein [Novosphingobium sp. G106]|uniref:hypothetical protein n=1 Tax=Novosphingobium sp. G106 TaxID=2849500 RepID=UPI00281181E8|nr:hypothetical protein [Novosphingobium sp. G106]
MRQFVRSLLPLLALLPQPIAAQVISYDLAFVEADPAPVSPVPDNGSERVVELAQPQASHGGQAYGPFRLIDDSRAALEGITDETSVAAFEAMLRDHPGIATIEMIDCPGTEDDRANLRLGRMIRARGIATHVPGDGFVGSGAVELYLAGVRRRAEPGAEFAVHSWEDDTGREPGDYAADAPQNRAYLDYYRAMGMSEDEARSFYAMTNSVPFSSAKWMTAGEMDRWTRFDDPARKPLPVQADAPQFARAAPASPATRPVIYGPFRVIDDTHAAMAGVTDARTPAAFEAMLRDYPGIARLDMVDCPGTEDDRANLRLGRMIRAKGLVTYVPANGWVASGAVELFLAGTQRSAEPTARSAVHSWEDDTGRGPNDYSVDAPKNRSYLDYYRTMGMSEGEARAFYAMTNATPFARAQWLSTADMAHWTRLQPSPASDPAPRGTFAQAMPGSRGGLASAAY